MDLLGFWRRSGRLGRNYSALLLSFAVLFCVLPNVRAQEVPVYAIEPQYEMAKSFSEGLAGVLIDGRWGFIDRTGKVVIEPRFDQPRDIQNQPTVCSDCYYFVNGLAKVYVDGKMGFIDKTGKIVIEPRFHDLENFNAYGLARFKSDAGKYGFIDRTGKIVIPPVYDVIWDFYEGLAKFTKNNHKTYGFIDTTGKEVVKPQYEWVADYFTEGMAAFRANGKYGFLDKTGKVAIKPQYFEVNTFNFGKAYVVKDRNFDQTFYIDKKGNKVPAPKEIYFADHMYFSDGLLMVRKAGDYGYVDQKGKVVIKPQFYQARAFREGLAAVKVGNKWGFIDKTGRLVVKPQYDYVGNFSEGLAVVEVDDKAGFIDKNGKMVVKPQFVSVGSFSEGLALVTIAGPNQTFKDGYIANPLAAAK